MTLPVLPSDYSPGDVPLAADLNAIKAHAAYHLDRFTTVLKRTGTVQTFAHNTLNATTAMQWNGVVGAYNGLGWSSGTPSRIPIPAGADGRYIIILTAAWTAAAGGFRYSALAKNGVFLQPGLFAPGDAALESWMATTWETGVVAGDYLEIWVFQNKTTAGTLSINITGESPQVSLRRVEE